MWKDYFQNSLIYGLDINSDYLINEDRIRSFCGDQSNQSTIETIIEETGNFDIIVDDGSHFGNDQIASFTYLWPYLNAGGLYFIEDLWLAFSLKWGIGNSRINPSSIVPFLKERLEECLLQEKSIEYMHFYGSIVVIRKKE